MDPPAARLLLFAAAAAAAVSLVASPVSPSAADEALASAQDAATRCAATIVSISPCLPHVAAVALPLARSPPTPTDACCVAFLRAVSPSAEEGGGEVCLCHLLRNPLLLGFPIDAARLATLLPACAAGNAFAAATVEAATLFADACLELKALPELHVTPQSTTTAEISPAALSESVSKPMEMVPQAGSLVRSATAASGSGGIPIAVWILTAAAAVVVIS